MVQAQRETLSCWEGLQFAIIKANRLFTAAMGFLVECLWNISDENSHDMWMFVGCMF